jgi:hypothetical protein
MPKIGLVFGLRYDGTWYGPVGDGTHADARRLAGTPIGRRQKSGAVLYEGPRRVAVWIPGHLRPFAHNEPFVDEWLDTVG